MSRDSIAENVEVVKSKKHAPAESRPRIYGMRDRSIGQKLLTEFLQKKLAVPPTDGAVPPVLTLFDNYSIPEQLLGLFVICSCCARSCCHFSSRNNVVNRDDGEYNCLRISL